MKKLLVILLAVLLLVSFTSCNQDKIDNLEKKVAEKEAENETLKEEKEAIVKNYEDFEKVLKLENAVSQAYTNGWGGNPAVISFTEVPCDINASLSSTVVPTPGYLMGLLPLGENETIDDDSLNVQNDASGTITGAVAGTSFKDYSESLTFTDNSFTLLYGVKIKDSTETKTKKFTITLSGTYSISVKDNVKSVSFKMKLNDTPYDISYKRDQMTEKFIDAKINGNDVSLRLLNASL